MATRKKPFPIAPAVPRRLTTGQWQLDIVAIHTRAGFEDISQAVVFRRFYQYLGFLQGQAMTTRMLAQSIDDVSDKTELWTSDLTMVGFRFVQFSLSKWFGRLYKDQGAEKEARYIERWYAKFLELPPGTFA